MLSIHLRRADHVRHYSIAPSNETGWEMTLEEDRSVTRHARYEDWHHVERAVLVIRGETELLMARGWQQV
jgi:hypothetical protein